MMIILSVLLTMCLNGMCTKTSSLSATHKKGETIYSGTFDTGTKKSNKSNPISVFVVFLFIRNAEPSLGMFLRYAAITIIVASFNSGSIFYRHLYVFIFATSLIFTYIITRWFNISCDCENIEHPQMTLLSFCHRMRWCVFMHTHTHTRLCHYTSLMVTCVNFIQTLQMHLPHRIRKWKFRRIFGRTRWKNSIKRMGTIPRRTWCQRWVYHLFRFSILFIRRKAHLSSEMCFDQLYFRAKSLTFSFPSLPYLCLCVTFCWSFLFTIRNWWE